MQRSKSGEHDNQLTSSMYFLLGWGFVSWKRLSRPRSCWPPAQPGLSWIPTPWPPNATMPASALRFDRVGKEVKISYIYVAWFITSRWEAIASNVEFALVNPPLPL